MSRNLVASVRQRLLNISRARGEEFQLVLTWFGLERLLYRLTQSPYGGQFMLKGAMLFQLWTGQPHRSTRDLDLLGNGAPSTERLAQLFHDVCATTVEDDGITFPANAVQAEQIKENDEHQGIRIRIDAFGQCKTSSANRYRFRRRRHTRDTNDFVPSLAGLSGTSIVGLSSRNRRR